MIFKLYYLVQTVPGLEIMAPRAAELRRGRKEKKSGLASRTMATAANSETYSTTTTVHRTLTTGSHFQAKHSQHYTVTRGKLALQNPCKGQVLTFEDLVKTTKNPAIWTSGPFYHNYRVWPVTMSSVQRTICPMRTQIRWRLLRKRLDGSP